MPAPPRERFPTHVAHFAINADDIDRAQRFYQRVFGWRFEAWGPPGFLLIETGTRDAPGIRGALQQRRELIPGERMTGFECTIAVGDVDAAEQLVKANGGTIILPKTVIPTVGQLFFFRDPDGNVAGVMQYDSNAKDDV